MKFAERLFAPRQALPPAMAVALNDRFVHTASIAQIETVGKPRSRPRKMLCQKFAGFSDSVNDALGEF
jgi:hypothetical protein